MIRFVGEVWDNLAGWERGVLFACAVILAVCLGRYLMRPAPQLPPLFHEVPATTR